MKGARVTANALIVEYCQITSTFPTNSNHEHRNVTEVVAATEKHNTKIENDER